MAVRIRLSRRGRKKLAIYDVVVADSRAPRDGKFIEKIGTYNPNTVPATIQIEDDRALDWLVKGAQPSTTVRRMLSYKGLMMKKHLQIGVIKGAVTQEQADARFEEWKAQKDAKVQARVEKLGADKEAQAKARLEAEAKVSKAREEAILKAKAEKDAELAAQVAEANKTEEQKEAEEEGTEEKA
ncbi:MAG: 30S ribosomal protein S16 [Bernardetiaceae bacterium]|nr:30S ribosomal protein S16 [Bernardetiaceae bacterium]